MSLISESIYWGNWVVSLLGWIYWAYQLIRSFILYYRSEEGTSKFQIMLLHFLLFVANFLYLLYEVDVTFTPVFFTMLLLTDITGIWCFLLITQNEGESHHMMGASGNKNIKIMLICLIVCYFVSYFLPEHYGVKCS